MVNTGSQTHIELLFSSVWPWFCSRQFYPILSLVSECPSFIPKMFDPGLALLKDLPVLYTCSAVEFCFCLLAEVMYGTLLSTITCSTTVKEIHPVKLIVNTDFQYSIIAHTFL